MYFMTLLNIFILAILISFVKCEINWNGNNWAMQCDFKENDMSNFQIRGEDCGGKCSETPGCTHFTWTQFNGGTCWLKQGSVTKADAFSTDDKNMVCGVIDEVISQTTSQITSTLEEARNRGLKRHNKYRANHGVEDLVLSPEITAVAQNYAQHLASLGDLIHSNGIYGENLHFSCNMATLENSVELATDEWYNEIKLYDFNNPGFSMETGHFTQVVWKGSSKVGFGIATAQKDNMDCIYVVANYDPPGNFENQYTKNVLKNFK